jgi:NAD(P)-dependent dehydrogenase (short-subunit alcohol dehydrogenase family)
MRLNFFIALRATRAALAHMVDRGGGAIVNVASVNAFHHPDGAVIDYGAAKAALVNLTKALSQEFGTTPRRASASSRAWVEFRLAVSPRPEEVATLVVLLASERPGTSRARTTSSTAARSRPPESRRSVPHCFLRPDSGTLQTALWGEHG